MSTTDLLYLYQGDRLAWDAGRLVVTEPDLLARIDKPYLSASTAKAIHSCPARLAGQKALPQATDVFSAPEKGTAAHLVLERLYELPAGRRDEQHAMKILTDLLNEDPEPDQVDYASALGTDPVRHTQWIAAISSAFGGIWKIEDPTQVEVYARELHLDGVKVGGIPFKGFIDRIDGCLEHGLKIRDYKTGKDESRPNPRYSDDHGDQIRLYFAAVRAKLGVDAVEGALYYTEHGTWRTVDLSKRAIDKTLAGFAQSWSDLRSAVDSAAFEAKPSALCGWCPLVNSCPVARPKRKDNDPRESAPSAIDLGIPTLRPGGGAASSAGDAEPAAAAHTTSEATHQSATRQTEEDTVTYTRGARKEGKAWEPTNADGELNLNSYAAVGTIGLAGLSAELLSERTADLKAIGQAMGPAQLRSLTAILSRIVLSVQAQITGGSTDWSEGANTRARGALRSVINSIPLPIGQDGETWAKWESRATTFATAIVRTGMDLFDGPLADAPIDALLPKAPAVKAA